VFHRARSKDKATPPINANRSPAGGQCRGFPWRTTAIGTRIIDAIAIR